MCRARNGLRRRRHLGLESVELSHHLAAGLVEAGDRLRGDVPAFAVHDIHDPWRRRAHARAGPRSGGGMAAHRFVSRIIPAAEPAVMVIGKQLGVDDLRRLQLKKGRGPVRSPALPGSITALACFRCRHDSRARKVPIQVGRALGSGTFGARLDVRHPGPSARLAPGRTGPSAGHRLRAAAERRRGRRGETKAGYLRSDFWNIRSERSDAALAALAAFLASAAAC